MGMQLPRGLWRGHVTKVKFHISAFLAILRIAVHGKGLASRHPEAEVGICSIACACLQAVTVSHGHLQNGGASPGMGSACVHN